MITTSTLPQNISALYPFSPKGITLKNGHRLSYVDEGQGEAIFLIHGNPTWSFTFRELIKNLKKNYRVIAPDHLGMGLSDKPQDFDYLLQSHIDHLIELKESLKIDSFSLVVHDWGGAIGAGMALRFHEQLKSWVIMNTAAFTSKHIPFRINICRHKFFGEKIIRHLNGFAWPATFMAVEKPLSSDVKQGYLLPYQNYQTRIATARFVQDIPMESSHPSYSTLKNIEDHLPTLSAPKLILWGEKDFCFNHHFLKRWQEIFPEAQVKTYPKAGHYVMEDESQDVVKNVVEFFQKTIKG